MSETYFLVNAVLCSILFYISFCRIVKVDVTTKLLTRFAVWSSGAAAAGMGFASIFWGFVPNFWTCSILITNVVYMFSSMPLWVNGPPAEPVKEVNVTA